MKQAIRNILLIASTIRLLPHLLIYRLSKNRLIIHADVARWSNTLRLPMRPAGGRAFVELMTRYPEYRNLFYYRAGIVSKLFSFLCPPMSTLYICTSDIGPGLFVQHGFATIIAAKKIGANCWINQQVTIGFSNAADHPTILDNVIINAGAKVIGAVTIGSNSTVGANAVVVKDVPPNCTVVGVPGRIVRRNGERVDESL